MSYHIINFITVFNAITNVVVCKKCKSNVKFTESSKRGLRFKLVILCEKCKPTEIPNCPFVEKAYELNRRIIQAIRLLGICLNGIEKFCAFMDLPRPVFHSFYDKVVKTIGIAAQTVCKTSMEKAAEEEKKQKSENNESVIFHH